MRESFARGCSHIPEGGFYFFSLLYSRKADHQQGILFLCFCRLTNHIKQPNFASGCVCTYSLIFMRCIPALGQAMITFRSSSKFGKQMDFQCCRPCSNFDAKYEEGLQQHRVEKFFWAGGGGGWEWLRKKRMWRDPFSHTEIGH